MTVIKFPTEKVQYDRLTKAIASIDAALEKQSDAVANFRTVNEKLASSLNKLENSLGEYSQNLGNINIKSLGKHSRKLARIVKPYAVSAAN